MSIYLQLRILYLTIIPQTHIGCELLDSGQDAEHQVGYHKLISNKYDGNNNIHLFY